MSDEKTLKLAYRPVSAEQLIQHIRLVEAELAGATPDAALKTSGLAAEDAVRIAAAVHAFCRPRLLKRRLQRAQAKSPERAEKQSAALQAPIDDSDLIGLYGEATHRVLLASEDVLVAQRARATGER